MCHKKHKIGLSILPNEILCMIISHLDNPEDLASMECVNRLFYSLCHEIQVWMGVFSGRKHNHKLTKINKFVEKLIESLCKDYGIIAYKIASLSRTRYALERHRANGIATKTNAYGFIYCGQFSEGVLHGYGFEIMVQSNWVYFGQWKDGKKHGHGTWIKRKGQVWNGSYEFGFECSPQHIVHPNGNRVKLAFVNMWRRIKMPVTIVDKAGHTLQIDRMPGEDVSVHFTLSPSLCQNEDQKWLFTPIQLENFISRDYIDNFSVSSSVLEIDILKQIRTYYEPPSNNVNMMKYKHPESVNTVLAFMKKGYI